MVESIRSFVFPVTAKLLGQSPTDTECTFQDQPMHSSELVRWQAGAGNNLIHEAPDRLRLGRSSPLTGLQEPGDTPTRAWDPRDRECIQAWRKARRRRWGRRVVFDLSLKHLRC